MREFASLASQSKLSCAVLSCPVVSNSLWPHGLQPARLLRPRGFSRQEYCSGLPCPPPGGIFLNQRLNPSLLFGSPALAGGFLTTVPPGKTSFHCTQSLLRLHLHSLFFLYLSSRVWASRRQGIALLSLYPRWAEHCLVYSRCSRSTD